MDGNLRPASFDVALCTRSKMHLLPLSHGEILMKLVTIEDAKTGSLLVPSAGLLAHSLKSFVWLLWRLQ